MGKWCKRAWRLPLLGHILWCIWRKHNHRTSKRRCALTSNQKWLIWDLLGVWHLDFLFFLTGAGSLDSFSCSVFLLALVIGCSQCKERVGNHILIIVIILTYLRTFSFSLLFIRFFLEMLRVLLWEWDSPGVGKRERSVYRILLLPILVHLERA